jgi:hypothetical protein
MSVSIHLLDVVYSLQQEPAASKRCILSKSSVHISEDNRFTSAVALHGRAFGLEKRGA